MPQGEFHEAWHWTTTVTDCCGWQKWLCLLSLAGEHPGLCHWRDGQVCQLDHGGEESSQQSQQPWQPDPTSPGGFLLPFPTYTSHVVHLFVPTVQDEAGSAFCLCSSCNRFCTAIHTFDSLLPPPPHPPVRTRILHLPLNLARSLDSPQSPMSTAVSCPSPSCCLFYLLADLPCVMCQTHWLLPHLVLGKIFIPYAQVCHLHICKNRTTSTIAMIARLLWWNVLSWCVYASVCLRDLIRPESLGVSYSDLSRCLRLLRLSPRPSTPVSTVCRDWGRWTRLPSKWTPSVRDSPTYR